MEVNMNPDQISFAFSMAGILSGFLVWLLLTRLF